MIRLALPAALLALLATACGQSNGTIGAACTTTRDCEYGQVCNTTGSGGFCTRGCTFNGERGECPAGATCAQTGMGIGTTVLLCLPLCTEGATCRDGYECSTTVGTVKACKPKPSSM